MSHIDPAAEQLKAFQSMPCDGPIVMINLLKFKSDGGRELYAKYGENTMPLLAERGGRVLYQGKGRMTIIGEEDWDTVILVEYPSRDAFFDMVTSDAYQTHVHYRTEALEDSRLICTQQG
ncbi:MAG: DUF1330 domain-containing protein [Candidatus Hydrogenedentes bacterium]|nr:DUF1330 domain-containing protein [Candidatus Hydrogenedentota bacterium]